MEKILYMVLAQILNDQGLQDKAAQAAAEFLANTLPDVAEDTIGDFLANIGERLTAVNPDG